MFRAEFSLSSVETTIHIIKKGLKRKVQDGLTNSVKNPRWITSVQKKIVELELYKSRISYAMLCYSANFLPKKLFSKSLELDIASYNAITDWEQRLDSNRYVESTVERRRGWQLDNPPRWSLFMEVLGISRETKKKQVLSNIANLRARKERSKFSQAKTALVKLPLSYQEHPWSMSQLTLIFNGLVYPQMKKI